MSIPKDELTKEIIAEAFKEFWLKQFNNIWNRYGLFIPASLIPKDLQEQWQWVCTILEIDIQPKDIKWTKRDTAKAIKLAETVFFHNKSQNDTNVREEVLRIRSDTLEGRFGQFDLPEEVKNLNRQLMLGPNYATINRGK